MRKHFQLTCVEIRLNCCNLQQFCCSCNSTLRGIQMIQWFKMKAKPVLPLSKVDWMSLVYHLWPVFLEHNEYYRYLMEIWRKKTLINGPANRTIPYEVSNPHRLVWICYITFVWTLCCGLKDFGNKKIV